MEVKTELLTLLAKKVSDCTKCKELADTRIQTVFGNGNPNSKVLFLGEGPGADEDKEGIPFCGKSGQLLNNILSTCGIKREDVYVTNILKCRPPGNRTPAKEECANCESFLSAQIKVVNPLYIVCLGAVAAQNLLKTTTPIGYLRNIWHNHAGYKVLCTWHPSYALRSGERIKKEIYEDLQLLIKELT
jgi:DNA polymerase